jgi:hypothetical protein
MWDVPTLKETEKEAGVLTRSGAWGGFCNTGSVGRIENVQLAIQKAYSSGVKTPWFWLAFRHG